MNSVCVTEGAETMSEIEFIRELPRFQREITKLHAIVTAAMEKQEAIYKRHGIPVPGRISLEAIDLKDYKEDMLRIHKTLQRRVHNEYLPNIEAKKARLIAIAGICELIKSEYTGKFWEMYENRIGLSQDTTVYNWILEKGFRESGIELINTNRREFVQTLVRESGIPPERAKGVIDFFEIFWRYLRSSNVSDVIDTLSDDDGSLDHIPKMDRRRLISLSDSASEYREFFELAVTRLQRIFEYIESSDEILGGDIDEWSEKIFRDTGMNPLTVLRNEGQLRKLYNRLLGKVTPDKLRRILAGKPPGTLVVTPEGKEERSDLHKDLQYGKYSIDGAEFICLPDARFDLNDLSWEIPEEEPASKGEFVLLRSNSEIQVTVNGMSRPDLVRPVFWETIRRGHLFACKPSPADLIQIRNEYVDFRFSGRDGLICYPYLVLIGKRRSRDFDLSIHVNFLRFSSADQKGERCHFCCSHASEPLFQGELNHDGRTSCGERSVRLAEPKPGRILFSAVDPRTSRPFWVNGKRAEIPFFLKEVMLFSPYTGNQIQARRNKRPHQFGSHRFVLFLAATIPLESVEIHNLEIEDEIRKGSYRVLFLRWENQPVPCQISAVVTGDKEYNWKFIRCVNFKLHLNAEETRSTAHVVFTESQGRRPSDFKLVLTPSPGKELARSLFWNAIINNSKPQKTPLNTRANPLPKGPFRISGTALGDLLEPAWNPDQPGNAKIEISVCSADNVIAGVTFFVFPELEVHLPKGVRENEDFKVDVNLGAMGTHKVVMKNRRGRSRVKIPLEKSDNGIWHLRGSEFEASLELETLGTHLNLKAVPPYTGIKFGNSETGRIEPARKILKRELPHYDLIILATADSGNPALEVNGHPVRLHLRSPEPGLWILPMTSLSGILLAENTVRVVSGSTEWSFNIDFRLKLKEMNVNDYVVSDIVNGNISFGGPENSSIELKVTGYTDKARSYSLAGICFRPDGREVDNRSFAIKVDKVGPDSQVFTRYELSAVLIDQGTRHDFSRKWELFPESALTTRGNQAEILTEIEELLIAGRPYSAMRIYEKLLEKVESPYSPEITHTGVKVRKAVFAESVSRATLNICNALKKQYLFDVLEKFSD